MGLLELHGDLLAQPISIRSFQIRSLAYKNYCRECLSQSIHLVIAFGAHALLRDSMESWKSLTRTSKHIDFIPYRYDGCLVDFFEAGCRIGHVLKMCVGLLVKWSCHFQERSRLPDKQIHSLNQLLLKFPYLHKGFEKSRALFVTLDTNNDGAIDIQELLKSSSMLGIREVDHSVLQNIFRAADIDGSHEIDTAEFIIMLALFHLLKVSYWMDPSHLMRCETVHCVTFTVLQGEDVDSQLDTDVRDTLQLVEFVPADK